MRIIINCLHPVSGEFLTIPVKDIGPNNMEKVLDFMDRMKVNISSQEKEKFRQAVMEEALRSQKLSETY